MTHCGSGQFLQEVATVGEFEWLSDSSSGCYGVGCLRFVNVVFPDHIHLLFVMMLNGVGRGVLPYFIFCVDLR